MHRQHFGPACHPCFTAGSGLLGIFVSLVLPLLPIQAYATPFRPDVLEQLRSDGRMPEVVSGIEDARARGLDHPPPSARGWLRVVGAGDGIPDRGGSNRQAIVILVDFVDNPADLINYPPQHFSDLLFSVGTYPTGSMRDWYLENSYGEFNVTGAVTIWYRMPQTYAYYVDGQAGFGTYPQNAQKLAEDAVAAANAAVDFSLYDNDGPDGVPDSGDDDGYVDALFVVHAGPGREATGSDDDIHSHSWAMSTPQPVDGVLAYGYTMEPEDGKRGVFGHEFGHTLGLPDLYDTDYSSSGIGNWCMMSFGTWGNGGVTPVHFSAWCKATLGYVDPAAPENNLLNASIPRVEDNPTIYRLWTNGMAGPQYFLVENRQKVLSDAYLPGPGLLIYHVDETIGGNQDETHPLVAVEQADGLFELEAGGASDGGDPFPGTANNFLFAEGTNPNSRDYAGQITQVRVSLDTGSQNNMIADLTVETQPNLVLAASLLNDEIGGDGDGRLDPGESVSLSTTLRNVGLVVLNVNGTLTDPGGQGITITQGSSGYGNIGPNQEASGTPPFQFSLAPLSTLEAVQLGLNLTGSGGYAKTIPLLFGVSDSLHFFQWTHDGVSPGYVDQWHLSTERNHTPGGIYSWKFGDQGSGNYADRGDGALTTSGIGVGPSTVLRFWYWIDAEDQDATTAWDGGILEVSIEDGPWNQITPVGGYPYTIIPNPDSPFPGGTPCYSGHSATWQQVTVNLGGLGDWVELRWRFGSDGYVTFEGWHIDDVTVEDATTVALGDPEAAENTRGQLWLAAPSPNPMTDESSISFRVARPHCGYRLDLYNQGGRLVRSLSRGTTPAGGWHELLSWDRKTRTGARAPSGVYFLQLRIEGEAPQTQKLVVR